MYNPHEKKFTQFTVKTPCELLPFIQQCLDGISRNKAKAILQGGGIKVDRHIVTQHDFALEPGMTVEISKRKNAPALNNRFVRLVYEDRHLLVIDKQPGILSMPAEHHDFSVKSVLDDYLHRCHQKCTAHVVHRLDRDTSGLMVYAKTMEAEQILEDNWHEIVTDRRYVALVKGQMEEKEGHIESWLRDNKAFFTYSSPTDNGGKYALTHFRTLRVGEKHSLVELRLETGRKNQIRVHMMDIGHPVCGDPKYGNADNPAGRLCLHAYRLYFYHPMTSELLKFETPVPRSFMRVFQQKTQKQASEKHT